MGCCFSTRARRVERGRGTPPPEHNPHLITHQVGASSVEPDSVQSKNKDSGSSAAQLLNRFQQHGDLTDLQRAISLLEADVGPTVASDHQCPHCVATLTNLGIALLLRFNYLGELSDLEQGISKHREVVQLTPDGHPDRPYRLNNLASSLLTHFWRFGELSDLEQVVSMHREAVQLTPGDHPNKLMFLCNLSASLRTRFKRLGELDDLEQAVLLEEEALHLIPEDYPDKSIHLTSLANSLFIRFKYVGELTDLEQAIYRIREAIQLTPDSHPDKLARLSHLSIFFFARFARVGEQDDLEQAISMQRQTLQLVPDDHPDKSSHFVDLANSLAIRFQRFGELNDLEEAISKFMEAIQLTPDDHPDKPTRLNNFAISLVDRYKCLGRLDDLEQGISKFKEAVQLTPDGHPDKAHRLSHLANSLVTRFGLFGEVDDLEQGISRHREAVQLVPDGQPEKFAHLANLGASLRFRFEHLDELDDLEQSILKLGEAICLTPDHHPRKPHYLSSLATSLLMRFRRLGELDDLQKSVSWNKEAVALTPSDHPDKPGRLAMFSNAFRIRFDHLGELHDLEQAISMYTEAIQLIPHGHPDKPTFLSNLASTFVARFQCLNDLSDLERAISMYSDAACSSFGPTTDRFRASKEWIALARSLGHPSLLRAYSTAIALLPQLAWIGLSLSHRFRELVQSADVVREGAATALDLGHPELAVEWLEQGRSIVWGELYQLRSSFDELSSAYPDLARRLGKLSAELEHASIARDKFPSSLSEQVQGAEHHSTLSLEQVADRHRALAIERDKLLQEIHGLPGFERFLLHKEFAQLRASAHSGPVVILNAAENRCDALIVLADKEDVIHVPLTGFTFKQSGGLQKMLQGLLGRAPIIRHDDRDGQRVSLGHLSWEFILSALWKGVVKPVLDVLGFSTPGKLSRIFWCPTGPFTFLPIHAAGLYGDQYLEPGHKVFDFVISSYAPTISILAPPPNQDTNSDGDFRLLVVPQPPSDGQTPLPGVNAELEYIRTVIDNCPSPTTLLEPPSGTVEDVLAQMKLAHWVHFACHGVQDTANPTESGLCLADRRRLKVSDIIGLSRPRGGLAFLSACQTATGDKALADEAVHIAAGMLFAGYGGVVGTMWSINDRVAPLVARDVYEQLFRTGVPSCREAAGALHDAVGQLRKRGARFVEWLPFIHVGL